MQRRKCSKCCTEVPWARAHPLAREGKEEEEKLRKGRRKKARREKTTTWKVGSTGATVAQLYRGRAESPPRGNEPNDEPLRP